MLIASGPYPSERSRHWLLRVRRAEKAALEAYLDAVTACDLLDAELRARLTGLDVDGYRSAVAECMTCWVLAAKAGLRVGSRPDGRRGRRLDLSALCPRSGQELHIEVKAPSVEMPPNRHWAGNDAPVLVERLRAANEQFEQERANVLVVTPQFRTPIFMERDQLVEAFIGQPVVTFAIDTTTGVGTEPEVVFRPDGEFVQPRNVTAAGRGPRFTRVGAVVCIEDVLVEKEDASRYTRDQLREASARGDKGPITDVFYEHLMRREREDHDAWVEHRVFVVHNPNATVSIDERVFEAFPQLVKRGDQMIWTDGYEDS